MNDNKLIVSNSLILFFRLFTISLLGLISTRLLLKNLGLSDFGVFNVVGGLVVLISIVNSIMLTTTNRFIAYEIGNGSISRINKVFNITLTIQIVSGIFILIIGIPLGEWYIKNHLNISLNEISNVLWVFRATIISSLFTYIGIPFSGLILAKENFIVLSTVEILVSICKLIAAFVISYFSGYRLIIYAVIISFFTIFPTIFFALYCKKKYYNLVKIQFNKNIFEYKEIYNFSIWVGYGALASISKIQGASIIINYFFGPILNAATGIANSVNGILVSFSGNIGKSISPQITKSYASNNLGRTEMLVILSSKFTFFFLLLSSFPVLLETDYILNIWLDEVPQYTAIFIKLMIIDALIGSLNSGVPDAVFASGKIKWYQIIINTLFLFSIPISFYLLKYNANPLIIFNVFIFISIVAVFIRQFLLHYIVHFNIKTLILHSYIPCISVTLLLIPSFFLKYLISNPLSNIIFSFLYLILCIYFVGMNKNEKKYFNTLVYSYLKKHIK